MTCIMSYWVTSKFISVEHTKDQKRLAKLLSSFDIVQNSKTGKNRANKNSMIFDGDVVQFS